MLDFLVLVLFYLKIEILYNDQVYIPIFYDKTKDYPNENPDTGLIQRDRTLLNNFARDYGRDKSVPRVDPEVVRIIK